MQIGCVRFAGVERHDHPLAPGVDPHITHTWNSHERFAQFPHAFIAILAFSRNRDPLENWLVRAL